MQVRYDDNTFSKPEPFDEKKMKEFLKDAKVKHVEVFQATPKNMRKRLRRHRKRPHTDNDATRFERLIKQ